MNWPMCSTDSRGPETQRTESPREGQGHGHQLLLLLARGRLGPDENGRAERLLRAGVRWDSVIGLAEAEGVYPLVYRNLHRLDFLGVPSDACATLGEWHKANALRNTVLARELAQVLTVLGDAGLPVVPLKGPGLGESLYGNPDLRTCTDL